MATITDQITDVEAWVKSTVSPTIELRSYQLEIWSLLWQRRARHNHKRALIHLATGLGKTSVAAVDALHYQRVENPGSQILFVSHMNDISEQAKETFLRVDPSITTSNYRSGNTIKPTNVVFATFQSLHRNLDQIDASKFAYIIWDEAHHIEADTFMKVREHFTPEFELGLTATPERADGLDILDYFGKPLYIKSLADGIGEGWLSAVDYHIVFDDAVKDAMKKGFELKTVKDIRDLFANRARNEIIAQTVSNRRAQIGVNAKTIVFCQNTQAAGEMAKLLGGEPYHSEIDREIRGKTLDRFRNGGLQVICTVDMFNEGIDIPDARMIVFLRSTSSRTIFEQQLGRGLRRAPGKKSVMILDFVANVERINFVRDLGHTVTRMAQVVRAEGGHGGSGRGEAVDHAVNFDSPYFDLSNFEFEDQTIELLDRYNDIRGKYHIETELIVKAFEETKSVTKVAEKFGVSNTAIYKRLKSEGINTNGVTRPDITNEEVAKIYYELGSTNATARHFGVSKDTVLDRLRKIGYTPFPRSRQKYSDEYIVKVYHENDNNIRATARALETDRVALGRRLKKLGVDTSRPHNPIISEYKLKKYYDLTNGSIVDIVKVFKSDRDSRAGWTDVYRALDEYGYLDKRDGPITSAQAAAAYYKFGTAQKASEVLGVSTSYISRLSKGASYIKKYKNKEVK